MKQSPQDKELEQMLHSSRLVAGGFMGADSRSSAEIIAQDLKTLRHLGCDQRGVAQRMRQLKDIAAPSLGNWIQVQDNLRVKSQDHKGFLICPWAHAGRYEKRITTAERLDIQKSLSWSDLNIHLIAEHGFFEGKGSLYRIEPDELVSILF